MRMVLRFLARTCDRALAVGMLAQAQWLYQVLRSISYETAAVLYRDKFV